MAAAIKQEGNFNSKRLQIYKTLSKMTIQAPVFRYIRSLKTLIYLLQSLITLRETLTPSITVIILLKNS